jgi:hypothetical protein
MSTTGKIAGSLADYEDERSFGSRLRARRIVPLLGMIEDVFALHGSVTIIDIGGTEEYWNIVSDRFLADHKVRITIANLPGTETSEDHDCFSFVAADGCRLEGMDDHSFHIAHSNSVVEHVGDWSRMVQFADEVKRIAPRWFVQTPNYWFPVEPHFMVPLFHWLPRPARVWLVLHFQLGQWRKASSTDEAVRIVESARLLNRAMFKSLFEDAQVVTERFFLLPKSFIAVRK